MVDCAGHNAELGSGLAAVMGRQCRTLAASGQEGAATISAFAAAKLLNASTGAINAGRKLLESVNLRASGKVPRGPYSGAGAKSGTAGAKSGAKGHDAPEVLETPADLLNQISGLPNHGNTCFFSTALASLMKLGLEKCGTAANMMAALAPLRGDVFTLPRLNDAVTNDSVARCVANVLFKWAEAISLYGPNGRLAQAARRQQRDDAHVVLVDHLRRHATPYQRRTGHAWDLGSPQEFLDQFANTDAGFAVIDALTGVGRFQECLAGLGEFFFVAPNKNFHWSADIRLRPSVDDNVAHTSVATDVLPNLHLRVDDELVTGQRYGLLLNYDYAGEFGLKRRLHSVNCATDANGFAGGNITITDRNDNQFFASVRSVAQSDHLGKRYQGGHFVTQLFSAVNHALAMVLNDAAPVQCFPRENTTNEKATMFSLLITVLDPLPADVQEPVVVNNDEDGDENDSDVDDGDDADAEDDETVLGDGGNHDDDGNGDNGNGDSADGSGGDGDHGASGSAGDNAGSGGAGGAGGSSQGGASGADGASGGGAGGAGAPRRTGRKPVPKKRGLTGGADGAGQSGDGGAGATRRSGRATKTPARFLDAPSPPPAPRAGLSFVYYFIILIISFFKKNFNLIYMYFTTSFLRNFGKFVFLYIIN